MGELQHHEIEGLLRSAAMAPLSQETTRRVLIEYQALLAKHRELRELLERLTPALGELRKAMSELTTRLDGWRSRRPNGMSEGAGPCQWVCWVGVLVVGLAASADLAVERRRLGQDAVVGGRVFRTVVPRGEVVRVGRLGCRVHAALHTHVVGAAGD
jgi:hypothetical protein